jgi:hypothetical protein
MYRRSGSENNLVGFWFGLVGENRVGKGVKSMRKKGKDDVMSPWSSYFKALHPPKQTSDRL